MNRQDFDAIVAATAARTTELLIKKGAEYAGDADRLANFKRNAEKNGQTVLETWQTYWGKHVDSINSYMARVKDEAVRMALDETIRIVVEANQQDRSKFYAIAIDPSRFRLRVNDHLPEAVRRIDVQLSESIEGRFDDNINYSVLCQAILKELRMPAFAGGTGGTVRVELK